jgi:hypothetical protein
MRAEFAELAGHDAYDLLGLSPEASGQQIQRAYRTLVKANHPDLFLDSRAKTEAEENIRLLNAARDVLMSRRAAYDAFLSAPDEEADEEEIIEDDPWAAAEPGVPPPGPWASADSFEPPRPPPSPLPPRPGGRPMPPPPRYGHSPGIPPFLPPLRPRPHRSLGARIAMGCAAVWGGLWIVGTGISLLSPSLHSPSGPKPSASVPKRFAGTWVGVFGGQGESHVNGWKAELTLREGKHNGEVRYQGGACAGTAVPVSSQANQLTVRTVFSEQEAGCDVGRIKLTKSGSHKLNVRFVKGGTVNWSGSLSRP